MMPVQRNLLNILKKDMQILALNEEREDPMGTVNVGKWQGRTVAIKVFGLKSLPQHLEATLDCYRLEHPNLTQVFGFCSHPGKFSMVMELAPLNLHKLLKQKGALDESELLPYAIDIGNGLSFLHLNKTTHKNLKLENVLLFPEGAEFDEKMPPTVQQQYVAKLCDFNMSKIKLETSSNLPTNKGTVKYRAPETFERSYRNSKDVIGEEMAADVFSFAMLMLSMQLGKPPHSALTEKDFCLYNAIYVGRELDPKWPTFHKDLMQSCWHLEPSKRPTAQKVVTMLEGRKKELKA